MKSMKFALVIVFVLTVSACTRPTNSFQAVTEVASEQPTMAAESTVIAVSSPTSLTTPIPEPTTTQQAVLPAATEAVPYDPATFTSFTVASNVEGLLFRMGPGTLFPAWRMLGPDDELTVLGTAAGNEWTKVAIEDGTEGWVFNQLLNTDKDLTLLPLADTAAQTFTGSVSDAAGNPIRGVVFNISGGSTDVVVVTDKYGKFYWHSPAGTTGSYQMSQTGIACDSNIWTGGTCDVMVPGFIGSAEPASYEFTLPFSGTNPAFLFR